MPRLVYTISSLKHYQLKYTNHVICAPHCWVCPVFSVSGKWRTNSINVKLCEAEIHTGYIAHGCKRVCCGPVEFSFGPWTPASWTIWMVEAVSSGSPDPDLPTPPAWHKLLLSSLHIISLSCSGINRPPASLKCTHVCQQERVCAQQTVILSSFSQESEH